MFIEPAVEKRLQEVLGTSLGAEIQELLGNPMVTEVRINPDGKLWKDELGQGKGFTGTIIPSERTKRIIQAVAYGVNAGCDENNPDIGAEMPISGFRFQGMVPPLVDAPTLIIRKKAVSIFPLSALVAQGVLSREIAAYLEKCIVEGKNIVVGGSTNSGKTTFCNALLEVMGRLEKRILIVEDTHELQCAGDDVVFIRTTEKRTLQDCVKVAMRSTPDRLVIGEVRGGEALGLIKAWYTGHPGISTVHARSAPLSLIRLEQLAQEGGGQHLRDSIGGVVNVVVYMEKVGTRRLVREVIEVLGVKDGEYETNTIYENKEGSL